ncbi:hypothetical protein CVT26_000268 [Gymnopilus dilepis]|uniref:Restriction of telomere capping protein 4 n=1 Tax=Gymnopilus dilepis TaxID=231916 RepID=A0A409WE12_9AGAR|nr:hypothetical protein CVT26_000268 [Gymnopilus dilepis]
MSSDPEIKSIRHCPKCGKAMGGLRVYEGTVNGHQHLRGRIVQSCTDVYCHNVEFHTRISYLWTDAEALIQRVRAREAGVPIPPTFLNVPLRVIEPLAAPNGPVECRGTCKSGSTGQRGRGSQSCIGQLCKKCCTNAFETARANNVPRDPCKAHKVGPVREDPALLGQAHIPSLTTPPASIPTIPPASVPPTLPSALVPSTSLPISAPNLSDSAPLLDGASALQITPTASQTQPSAPNEINANQTSKGRGRGRALANPIGPNWLKEYDNANSEQQKFDDLKARRARIDEEMKRTIEFVVYYEEDTDPFVMELYVDTYPKAKIEALTLLVKNFELDENSLFDYWEQPNWRTITPSSNLSVERGRSVILRRRASLVKQLAVDKCPGLAKRIGTPIRSTTKRTADTALVSPIKKAVRQDELSTVPARKDADQIPANNSDGSASLPHLTRQLPHVPDHSALTSPLSENTQPPLDENSLGPSATVTACILLSGNQPNAEPLVGPDTAGAGVDDDHEALNNVSVAQFVSGMEKMLKLRDDERISRKTSFPTLFGMRYVKETFCKYQRLWNRAPPQLKTDFLALGNVPKASLLNFSTAIRRGLISLPPTTSGPSPHPSLPPKVQTDGDSTPNTCSPPADPPPETGPRAADLNLRLPSLPPVAQHEKVLPEHPAVLHGCSLPANPPIETASLTPAPFPRLPSPPAATVEPGIVPEILVKPERMDNDLEITDELDVADHSNLCPFCDESLPESPTEELLKLRKDAEEKSWPDPMPFNRHHRSAISFQVFISYCARHMFEKDQLPLAIASGWPMKVDFGAIFDRVSRQFLLLRSIAQDLQNEFLTAAKEFYAPGLSQRQGLLSQMGRMSDVGAGYYGGPGYQLIMITLQHLFPRSSISLIDIHPLSYDIFLREVLALEAAAHLIQNDLGITRKDAILVLQQSRTFGNNIHDPDAPEIEIHIRNALRRSRMSPQHDELTYRKWIASGSKLSVDQWLEEERSRPPSTDGSKSQQENELDEEEIRIKQEEMDADPFADMPEQHVDLKGAGLREDPIDLTDD